MEYKNSFTRDQLERLVCDSIGRVQSLACSLLAEMDKPKVWDGSPDNAIMAQVHFYKAPKTYATPAAIPKVYTRELPKSRAREIAEEVWHEINKGAVDPISAIEDIIIKIKAELKEGKE